MKNLKDYITESNGIKWFDIIKQQLIKYTESRGDVTTLREVYNYI